jgi:Holliday junction resolvase-like predicted endonuclease
MPESEPFEKKPSSWHIAVAAEAIAAAQFARYGFDVSVQYGADQPEYDLVIARGDHLLKVSVKGSQDGGWGLTQTYLKAATEESGRKGDYHGAIDLWLKRHGSKTVFCFVQFWGVASDQMPRMYLATVNEVAQALRAAKGGEGDSVLNEDWTFRKGRCAGMTDKLPVHWLFSGQRIEQLLMHSDAGLIVKATT